MCISQRLINLVRLFPIFSWVFDGKEGTKKNCNCFWRSPSDYVSRIGHKELKMDVEIPDVERFDVRPRWKHFYQICVLWRYPHPKKSY